jgi:acyl phosphate:glycerol-3-phosphate acyltransferase
VAISIGIIQQNKGRKMTNIYAILIGYLLGSIPFGLIIAKLGGAGDIRTIGSGNIGATNVLRSGRKGLAAATLICDALKGTIAVLLFGWIAGAAAFIGHIFPVWLKFKGGKGVATFIGVLLAVHWVSGLIFIAIWLFIAFISKYSSLAALIAATSAPISLALFGMQTESIVFTVMAGILAAMHHENIARLLRGEEGKIGAK